MPPGYRLVFRPAVRSDSSPIPRIEASVGEAAQPLPAA